MNYKPTHEFRYFFFSQAFADGVRTTFAVLLPALALSYLGKFDTGMIISFGALGVSITDAPGPVVHRRNGMLLCVLFIFIIAIITAAININPLLLGMELFIASFFFSMFTVYGNRAASVGSAALLVMILTMDQPVGPADVFMYGILVLAGGCWYLVISLVFHNLQPYRAAQRLLGESIREIADYLSIKANFYNPASDFDKEYSKLVKEQIQVSEKQDAVREMMFKTRQILRESTSTSRKLVWTFVETVDLFEEVTATYYDYHSLRNKFGNTGVLEKISLFIKEISIQLDRMGIAMQLNTSYRKPDLEIQLLKLKEAIDLIPAEGSESNLVLKKIIVRLRKLVQRLNEVYTYFEKEPGKKKTRSSIDHSHFVTHQPLDPRIMWTNLTLRSSAFRHAVRVAVACLIGYIVFQSVSYGNYSYWILLTIAFILKPAFSLTRQRNIERLIGTFIGGILGVLILYFIPNKDIQFAFLVLFMIANYSFMRINYLAMVLCVTPFVVILFNFLGVGFFEVAQERILDTVIGCVIALSASYFLFPTWESEQLKMHMTGMLRANAEYLQKIIDALSGKNLSLLDYKLARKNVYVSSANLAAAFQRMLSEPRKKQQHSKEVHQFVVLSHILFSNIANIATTLTGTENAPASHQLCIIAKRSKRMLERTIGEMENREEQPVIPDEVMLPIKLDANDIENGLMKEQLDFINKVIIDIEKITRSMNYGKDFERSNLI